MRLSASLRNGLLGFARVESTDPATAQTPTVNAGAGQRTHLLAYRFSLLLSIWLGISSMTELLLWTTWPGLWTALLYIGVSLALIVRYPMWAHRWYAQTTSVSVHLWWLGTGMLLALIGCFIPPKPMLFALIVLAVEGYLVLAFYRRCWARGWFAGMALTAGTVYALGNPTTAGLVEAVRYAPFMLAALVGIEILVAALFPPAAKPEKEPVQPATGPASVQRYHNYVNRIEALAVDRERARIAREFHDTLGHTLTTLDVQMELMARLPAARITDIQEAAQQSRTLVKDGLADVRRSIRALHPNALEAFSIVEAIQGLVDEFERATTATVQWRVEGKVAPLAPDLALPLYRAAQEALTNVRRHSGASEVRITLAFATEMIWLIVEDNGRAQSPQKFGFGLSGIRDRVKELHGHFAAGPRIEGGFRIVVKLPR